MTKRQLLPICIVLTVRVFLWSDTVAQTIHQNEFSRDLTDYDSTFSVSISHLMEPIQVHIRIGSVPGDTLSESIGWRDRFYNIILSSFHSNDTLQRVDGFSYEALPLSRFDEMFSIEDMNFDGYLDFRFEVERGAAGNALYEFWVYCPDSHVFVRDDQFRELISPSFSHQKREITTSVRCGWGCANVGVYRFKGKRLLQVRRVAMSFSRFSGDSTYVKVERGLLIDGKMTVIQTKTVSLEEAYEELSRP